LKAEDTVHCMDFPWHSGKVLEQLNQQRQLGLLCDCTFVVDGIDFKAHKAVLAACSAYFRTLFLDQKDVVHLDISNAAGVCLMNVKSINSNIYFIGGILWHI
uniref:BTB domain-containing protein n=1 Tax=Denticeps clupeoides TaxID=299321 RepID=A0AAY4B698_9TELE